MSEKHETDADFDFVAAYRKVSGQVNDDPEWEAPIPLESQGKVMAILRPGKLPALEWWR